MNKEDFTDESIVTEPAKRKYSRVKRESTSLDKRISCARHIANLLIKHGESNGGRDEMSITLAMAKEFAGV